MKKDYLEHLDDVEFDEALEEAINKIFSLPEDDCQTRNSRIRDVPAELDHE